MSLKLNDNKYIDHLLFADNIEEDEEATYMFHQVKDTYEEWGLKKNVSKAEHLTKSSNADTLLDDINAKLLRNSNTLDLTFIKMDRAKEMYRQGRSQKSNYNVEFYSGKH